MSAKDPRLYLALAFELQIAAMAADPEVQAECAIIAEEFSAADLDGLRHD